MGVIVRGKRNVQGELQGEWGTARGMSGKATFFMVVVENNREKFPGENFWINVQGKVQGTSGECPQPHSGLQISMWCFFYVPAHLTHSF